MSRPGSTTFSRRAPSFESEFAAKPHGPLDQARCSACPQRTWPDYATCPATKRRWAPPGLRVHRAVRVGFQPRPTAARSPRSMTTGSSSSVFRAPTEADLVMRASPVALRRSCALPLELTSEAEPTSRVQPILPTGRRVCASYLPEGSISSRRPALPLRYAPPGALLTI